ncbi:ATP-binding protein [Marinomonas sp. S3726]|uniref:ATP-binding protein n=1 Tax=Marinomonas sp. S3726 TaxID=579484 RepID=UPI000698435C|nr:ATP-binding protein [Marinomonas sp. S3726]
MASNKLHIKWYLAAIGVLLLAIVFYINILIVNNQQQELSRVSQDLRASIIGKLQGNLDYINLLAEMRRRNEVDAQSFESRSSAYLKAHPELINFTWVDQDFYIRSVSPLRGNRQILGLHLDLAEPARVSALAKKTKQAHYTKAFEAIQGDCSFEVWYPVYRDNEFLGLIAGVYSCEKLLRSVSVSVSSISNHYLVGLTDSKDSFFISLNQRQNADMDNNHKVKLGLENDLVVSVTRLKTSFGDINLYILFLAIVLLIVLASITGLKLKRDMAKRETLLEELRQANHYISESESRFKLIFDSSPVGMILVDDAGHIVDVNQFICQIFGYDVQHLLQKSIDYLVPEEQRTGYIWEQGKYRPISPDVDKALMSDLDAFTGLCANGEVISVQVALAPIKLLSRWHTLVSVIDNTERNQLFDQLKIQNNKLNQSNSSLVKVNEQLERFAYICSHDLQEPVRMVQGFGPLLETQLEGKLDEKSQKYLHYMVDGANRARDMIDDILEYCRSDKVITNYQSVDLGKTCQHVNETLLNQFAQRNGQFIWEENLPHLPAVPSQLFQLILNIVNNGLKFNHSETPLVALKVLSIDDHWQIRITDNGIGIASQYQKQIFNIFERLHGNSEFPGTGIGLASCQKIVERHFGSIHLESQLEQGSTFIINWPKQQKI